MAATHAEAIDDAHALVSRTVHAAQVAPSTAQPDPGLGTPGSYRRLGCPPARSHRAGDRAVQAPERPGGEEATPGAGTGDFNEEIDLRAEDDALIAAELEAAALEAERERAEVEAAAERERAERAERGVDEDEIDEDEDEAETPARRRSRRGGRGRRRPATRSTAPLEGTFDHGEEGYGLWLDPAVQDNPIYAEHWAGHRPVEVLVEEDQIIIRRVGGDD